MQRWVALQACRNQDSASCPVRLWIKSPSVSGKWLVSWISSRLAPKGSCRWEPRALYEAGGVPKHLQEQIGLRGFQALQAMRRKSPLWKPVEVFRNCCFWEENHRLWTMNPELPPSSGQRQSIFKGQAQQGWRKGSGAGSVLQDRISEDVWRTSGSITE